MKYLFFVFLLVCSVSFAADKTGLDKFPDIRLGMYFCGYEHPYAPEFVEKATQAQIDCIVSKKQEVKDFIKNQDDKDKLKQDAKAVIKSYDCNSILDAFVKLLCEERK